MEELETWIAVFVDSGAVERLDLLVGSPLKMLLNVGGTVWVENK